MTPWTVAVVMVAYYASLGYCCKRGMDEVLVMLVFMLSLIAIGVLVTGVAK